MAKVGLAVAKVSNIKSSPITEYEMDSIVCLRLRFARDHGLSVFPRGMAWTRK
jgi:hypothetical protein